MLRYGLRSKSLRDAAVSLSELFGVQFELHDSSFRGGDYFRADVTPGTIYVQSNLDILDDEPFEAAWPSDQFLLSFAGLNDDEWQPYTKLLAELEGSMDVVLIKRVPSN
jgi:hypothetical protein